MGSRFDIRRLYAILEKAMLRAVRRVTRALSAASTCKGAFFPYGAYLNTDENGECHDHSREKVDPCSTGRTSRPSSRSEFTHSGSDRRPAGYLRRAGAADD